MALINIPTDVIWGTVASALNSMFSELFTRRNYGVYNYDDLATGVSPISIAAADTWYDLTNDGAGPQTLKYPLAAIADIWDTGTGTFDFSQLENGDSVDIRLDISVTTTTANQDVDVSLFLASDQVSPIEIPFIVEQSFKSAGTRKVIRFNSNFAGSDYTRINPAKFRIKSSATGSVVVNGWYCRVMPAKVQ